MQYVHIYVYAYYIVIDTTYRYDIIRPIALLRLSLLRLLGSNFPGNSLWT